MEVTSKLKVNIINIVIILTIILSVLGFLITKAGKSPISKVVLSKEDIGIEVLISDVHSKEKDLFNVGEKTFLTIRNKPYAELKIINIEERNKLALAYDRTGTYKAIPDPTKLNVFDYVLTLTDVAIKTKDGYVIGTDKIKIGNKVDLEGFNYKFSGQIVNIYPLKNLQAKIKNK